MDLRTGVLKMSKKLMHRGPDWSGIFYCEKFWKTECIPPLLFSLFYYNFKSIEKLIKTAFYGRKIL